MAFMSARINMPGQQFGTGLGKVFSDALFGDPATEIALAKMRSQLATDAWQRQQLQSVVDYNNARTATEQWNLEGRQGAVGPLQKILYDAQGEPAAAPAPIDLSGPETGAPLPQAKPDALYVQPDEVAPVPVQNIEPDVQVSPTNYPLRSEADMYSYPPEPDMTFGAYGVPQDALPPYAPVPVRRPGDLPPLASLLAGGVPPELAPGAQAAPISMGRPEVPGDLRPTIIDSGVSSTFPSRPAGPQLPQQPVPGGAPGVSDVASIFPARPGVTPPGAVRAFDPRGEPATADNFITLSDVYNWLSGSGPAPVGGELTQPQELSSYKAPGPFPARPGMVPQGNVEQPVALPPLPPHESGRRPGDFPLFDPNSQLGEVPPQLRQPFVGGALPSVSGTPEDLMPAPISVPEPESYPSLSEVPPELTPPAGGVSVDVPGRPQPVPPPAQAGGPAVTVPGRSSTEMMRDRPPPVSPDYPVSPNAFPITATGDVLLEPETRTVVVATPQGGGVRLSMEEMGALAKGIVASSTGAGDLATGTGKMAGLIGLQGGNLTPDQQRIAAMEYTGTLPSTSTMLTSQDTAPGVFEKQKTAAGGDKFDDVVEGKDGEFFRRTRNADGSVTLTPITPQGTATGAQPVAIPDLVTDVPGTAAEVGYINMLNDIAEAKRRGLPIANDPATQGLYRSLWNQLYGERAQSTMTAEGLVTGFTSGAVPENTPAPDVLFGAGGPAAGAGAVPAPAPPASSPEAGTAPAASPEAPEGQPVVGSRMSTLTTAAGKEQVKNYGGWYGDGETMPSETINETGPGGAKVTRRIQRQARTKAATEAAGRSYTMLREAVRAAVELDNIGPSDVPPAYQNAMNAIARVLADSPSGAAMAAVVDQLTDDESKRYARAIFTFINAKLRPDTGAAITPVEFDQYQRRFSLKSGEGWDNYLDVRAYRTDALRSIRDGLIGQVPDDQLKILDLEMQKQGLDLDWNPDDARRKLQEKRQQVYGDDGQGGFVQR